MWFCVSILGLLGCLQRCRKQGVWANRRSWAQTHHIGINNAATLHYDSNPRQSRRPTPLTWFSYVASVQYLGSVISAISRGNMFPSGPITSGPTFALTPCDTHMWRGKSPDRGSVGLREMAPDVGPRGRALLNSSVVRWNRRRKRRGQRRRLRHWMLKMAVVVMVYCCCFLYLERWKGGWVRALEEERTKRDCDAEPQRNEETQLVCAHAPSRA